MLKFCPRLVSLVLPFALLITFANRTTGAELTVKIRSPKDGSRVIQEQSYILIGGKVTTEASGLGNVDIFLVLDVSGSTAHYAGADFAEFSSAAEFLRKSK